MKKYAQLILVGITLTGIFQFTHELGHLVVTIAYGGRATWGFSSPIQMWDQAPRDESVWEPISLPTGDTGWVKFENPDTKSGEILFNSLGPIFSLAAFMIFLLSYVRSQSEQHQKLLLIGIFLLTFTLGFYYLTANTKVWSDEKAMAYLLDTTDLLFIIPLALIYFAGLAFSSVQLYKLGFRAKHFLIFIVTNIGTGVLMNRTQQIIIQQVDNGNALFNPILGFSAPVFLFFAFCFGLFAYLWRRWDIGVQKIMLA